MGALTWKLLDPDESRIAVDLGEPSPITVAWAWGGATGADVRVCVVDGGIESGHPLVGTVASSHAVVDRDGERKVVEVSHGDSFGHGTACAGIVREIAPDCEIHSVRVLSERGGGTGRTLLAGLEWAIRQRFDVINMSLSTTRPEFVQALRELADEAYFAGSVIVASAHNSPVESFPWRFSSVISVGSHTHLDPNRILYNPNPPVEFFARGQAVQVAGLRGSVIRSSGNSFATPHVAGRCALILSKHPRLTAFQLKTILFLTASNVRGERLDEPLYGAAGDLDRIGRHR
ncbi:S8 family peptidase [Micromonospora carbonacea]|uniref:S8 family serine peptidase n=1 Tax=Micromonospora carbonacea TaxID=47853 RepID=A0A7H8XLW4_9ACTN|nr:S8 family serine peptidase [Micromonospora carbonacea]MBB5825970.1 subtilisin family serine protease [Micromonospora carbonacea]QLD25558.1 S8 family serine peptidase [Micromonospora carbonacea]